MCELKNTYSQALTFCLRHLLFLFNDPKYPCAGFGLAEKMASTFILWDAVFTLELLCFNSNRLMLFVCNFTLDFIITQDSYHYTISIFIYPYSITNIYLFRDIRHGVYECKKEGGRDDVLSGLGGTWSRVAWPAILALQSIKSKCYPGQIIFEEPCMVGQFTKTVCKYVWKNCKMYKAVIK